MQTGDNRYKDINDVLTTNHSHNILTQNNNVPTTSSRVAAYVLHMFKFLFKKKPKTFFVSGKKQKKITKRG